MTSPGKARSAGTSFSFPSDWRMTFRAVREMARSFFALADGTVGEAAQVNPPRIRPIPSNAAPERLNQFARSVFVVFIIIFRSAAGVWQRPLLCSDPPILYDYRSRERSLVATKDI